MTLIARWPGKIAAGSVSDHRSGFQDMLPTLAELASIDSPDSDGISLVPTLLGNPSAQQQHPHLYWEFTERGGKQAVLKDNWKGVRLNWNEQPSGPIELYDLARDPSESTNVAAQHPEVAKMISAIMDREHVEP